MVSPEPGKPAPLYIQFDGEEVDGKRYSLGDKLDPDTHAGIVAVLTAQGRISGTPPTATTVVVSAIDKPVVAMTRPELESSVLAITAARIADRHDDELRDLIQRHRDDVGGTDGANDGGADDEGYDALKEKPLGSLKTAHLETVASAEGVDLSATKTNAERVAAIEAARATKSGS